MTNKEFILKNRIARLKARQDKESNPLDKTINLSIQKNLEDELKEEKEKREKQIKKK